MNYIKKCPICNIDINYSRIGDLNYSIKNNSKCRSCSAYNRLPKSDEERKKISIALTGRIIPKEVIEKRTISQKKVFNTEEYKKKLSILHKGNKNGMYNKKHSNETKNKMKVNHFDVIGENNPMFEKKHTENTKQKMREIMVERVKKYNIHSRNFNPIACKIIDEYGKENGYNFQHALNGGEYSCAGYLVDGYDKEKNVVIEIDEPHHNKPSQKEKDILRQRLIKDKLHCKFIRIPVNKSGDYKKLDIYI